MPVEVMIAVQKVGCKNSTATVSRPSRTRLQGVDARIGQMIALQHVKRLGAGRQPVRNGGRGSMSRCERGHVMPQSALDNIIITLKKHMPPLPIGVIDSILDYDWKSVKLQDIDLTIEIVLRMEAEVIVLQNKKPTEESGAIINMIFKILEKMYESKILSSNKEFEKQANKILIMGNM
jgi:hypothetical protein